MIHTQLALDMHTDFFLKIVNVYPFEELVQINIFVLGITLVSVVSLRLFYSLEGVQGVYGYGM